MKFINGPRKDHTGNLLTFGNPDLGHPAYDLPGAQNEAIAIIKDQPISKLLLRNKATETAVKKYSAGFRWKIDDNATSILMQQFYESLRKHDKRSALRTAQLKVKDTYCSHPYFWAAFQLTGSLQ